MSGAARRRAMIAGSPRSGTSWFGSIFDSHPGTVYIHEPDVIEEEPRLPFIAVDWETEPDDEVVREYFARLAANRSLRSVFSRQRFGKSYRSGAAAVLRDGMIRAGRIVDAGLPGLGRSSNFQIPDLAHGPIELTVVKSVDSITRLPAFARALPDVRFFYIVRHPCGVARSKQRGMDMGKMGPPPLYSDLFQLPTVKEMGVNREEAQSWPVMKQVAFQWLVTNEWVLNAVAPRENVRLVVYDELADDPLAAVPELFSFAGLQMKAKTRAYLERQLGLDRAQGDYFAIDRHPREAANEWRQSFAAADQAMVRDMVAGSRIGALFGL